MSRRRKLIERFQNSPDTVGMAEIRQLKTELGYEESSKAGSHCVFHKKGSYPLCVPTVEGKKVKKFYVQRLSETLNLQEENMNAPKRTSSEDPRDLRSLLSRRYPITLHPAEEGGYVAEIEDLPGCMAQGETVESTTAAIEECRVAWIETALGDGLEIPPPRRVIGHSGRLLLRLPKSLHRRLAARAR